MDKPVIGSIVKRPKEAPIKTEIFSGMYGCARYHRYTRPSGRIVKKKGDEYLIDFGTTSGLALVDCDDVYKSSLGFYCYYGSEMVVTNKYGGIK